MVSFLFKLPAESKDENLSKMAQDVIAVAALSERLAEEDRKRVAHRSGRAENVAEHALMLVKVAVMLAQKYYPELDAGKVAIYAAIHDDVEAYVGDTPTGEWCDTDYDEKRQREAAGLEKLKHDFVHLPSYIDSVKNYEQQDDAESRFVRMVDKVVVTVIQITDGGVEANKNFNKANFLSNEKHGYDRHIKAYSEWKAVLDIKMELASYVGSNLLGK